MELTQKTLIASKGRERDQKGSDMTEISNREPDLSELEFRDLITTFKASCQLSNK